MFDDVFEEVLCAVVCKKGKRNRLSIVSSVHWKGRGAGVGRKDADSEFHLLRMWRV